MEDYHLAEQQSWNHGESFEEQVGLLFVRREWILQQFQDLYYPRLLFDSQAEQLTLAGGRF